MDATNRSDHSHSCNSCMEREVKKAMKRVAHPIIDQMVHLMDNRIFSPAFFEYKVCRS